MIRTLLIDNYDSFTYNLFHILAQINGRPPTVISNDDSRFSLSDLRSYDNVVISAGPGDPRNHADFGLCAEVIRHTHIPLLGVCLGHQGIATAYGASVVRADEPVHGRLVRIRHTGHGLFTGLPDQLDVVCYNSLVVDALPPSLALDASTADGVVMALSHRHKAQWGLQFHPESACTEHGSQLLENFARRTVDDHPAARRDRAPEAIKADRSFVPDPVLATARMEVRQVHMACSAEELFGRIRTTSGASVWLDGSQSDHDRGRFTIMGAAAADDLRHVTADVSSGTVTVRDGQECRVLHQPFFDWLRDELMTYQIEAPPLPFDFTLGWVGYLGYELKAECAAVSPHRSALPDAALVFLDRAVVIDHHENVAYLLALCPLAGPDTRVLQWFEQTQAAASASADGPATCHQPDTGFELALHARHSRDQYLSLVGRCQELIAAGETYEVCLTNTITGAGRLDSLRAYKTLRAQNPAPFGAFLQLPGADVLSTSPEQFIRITADGEVESRPIKGTRGRGATATEDAAVRGELGASEKDRSENLMIVDLVRHDLGRTAAIGSVHADQLFEVETFATVHQLVSTIRSRLGSGATSVDCVRAAFPPGSMTGAPKLRTMSILDDLEAGPRGVYSGAIGYFSLNGAVDLSVAIRTLVVEPDQVTYGVGGAIVALSDPEAEYHETMVKAAPLLRLLGGAPFPQHGESPKGAL